MLRKCLCASLMLIVVIAVADVAVAAGTDVEGTHNGVFSYTVQPATNNGVDLYLYGPALSSPQECVVTYVNSNISPGERKHYTKNVTQDIYFLNVDLIWTNPDVGLTLLVFSPSGEQVGLFYDGSDGAVDRRINIDIFESNGGYIEKGRWDYYVIYDWGVEATEFTI
jgi:hypothetical protein